MVTALSFLPIDLSFRMGIVTTVQAYDTGTDKWEMLAPLPERLAGGPPANALGGKIYVVGGWSAVSGMPTDMTLVYDPDRNRWRR